MANKKISELFQIDDYFLTGQPNNVQFLASNVSLEDNYTSNKVSFAQISSIVYDSAVSRSTEMSNDLGQKFSDFKNSASLSIDGLSNFAYVNRANINYINSTTLPNISDALSNCIKKLSSDLSNDIKQLSSDLSNDIEKLSSDLSNDIISCVQVLDDKIITKFNSACALVTQLSDKTMLSITTEFDKLSNLISSDISVMPEIFADQSKPGLLKLMNNDSYLASQKCYPILLSSTVINDNIIWHGAYVKVPWKTEDPYKYEEISSYVVDTKTVFGNNFENYGKLSTTVDQHDELIVAGKEMSFDAYEFVCVVSCQQDSNRWFVGENVDGNIKLVETNLIEAISVDLDEGSYKKKQDDTENTPVKKYDLLTCNNDLEINTIYVGIDDRELTKKNILSAVYIDDDKTRFSAKGADTAFDGRITSLENEVNEIKYDIEGIDDNIDYLSNQISSTDVGQLNNKIDSLSDVLDDLSANLSNDIKKLSSDLSNDIKNDVVMKTYFSKKTNTITIASKVESQKEFECYINFINNNDNYHVLQIIDITCNNSNIKLVSAYVMNTKRVYIKIKNESNDSKSNFDITATVIAIADSVINRA